MVTIMPGIGVRCTGRIITDMTAAIIFISATIEDRQDITDMIITITIPILITHIILSFTMIIIIRPMQAIKIITTALILITSIIETLQGPELLKNPIPHESSTD